MLGSYSRSSLFKSHSFVILMLFLACGETKDKIGEHKYTNALIYETSPYLLQHAHNPVDWRPWSQEALKEAEKENKLVLVSIGYSSCHWCHVMEEETFEDEEVAKMMNEDFISIKVDREERPDVDQVYMTALQLLKGEGGWPLNVITLPNGKPLYGGTYHTKSQWNKILAEITRLYKEDPEKANEYADKLAAGIQEVNLITPSTDLDDLSEKVLDESVLQWKMNWDLEGGGEKGDQKFMLPNNLEFLMDYALLTDDKDARNHVKNTLDKMAMGGIYDQLDGGFFRYSTDKYWKIPHFEKMLYDNAQAIGLYSRAYKIFKEPLYKDIVLSTIDFLSNSMYHPEGGYYAAIDADSEGEEGVYYVWTEQELMSVLGDDFKNLAVYYGISPENIWENNRFSLFRPQEDEEFLKSQNVDREQLAVDKARWHKLLLSARKERVHPNIDDKIIVSWNALLISGLVDAYTAFGDQEFLDKAVSIYDFIENRMYNSKGLRHSYKKDSKHINGFLDDYTFLADASLALYGATLDGAYLEFAQNLTQKVQEEFLDAESKLFKYNSTDELISKIIKMNDGVLPSPNSVMAHNLHSLGHINYDKPAMEKSKQMLSSAVPLLKENAWSYANWSGLLLKTAHPYYEIAIVGKDAGELVQELNKEYLPNALVVGSEAQSELALFDNRYIEGNTFIYVCKDNSCKLPVATVAEAIEQLQSF